MPLFTLTYTLEGTTYGSHDVTTPTPPFCYHYLCPSCGKEWAWMGHWAGMHEFLSWPCTNCPAPTCAMHRWKIPGIFGEAERAALCSHPRLAHAYDFWPRELLAQHFLNLLSHHLRSQNA